MVALFPHERLGDPYLRLSRWFTEGMRRTFDDTPDRPESNLIKSKRGLPFCRPRCRSSIESKPGRSASEAAATAKTAAAAETATAAAR
ncbi:MAG: hypothetical protein K2Z80_11065, partial [Xanthobacteraceae bacterium]|nr:hypothetical protein [Xanthobacteraceae bacterium]